MEPAIDEAAQSSREKRKQLLDTMLARKAWKRKALIEPRPAGMDKVPLSLAQQRIWFLDQLALDPTVHNVPNVTRIRVALDPVLLGRAIDAVIQRHEVLRTVFDVVETQLCQIVLPQLKVEPVVVDIDDQAPADRQEAHLFQLIDEAVSQPFDLRTGPLLRVHAYRCADDNFVILIVVHHIVFDAWSIGLLNKELLDCYKAFSMGQPSPLPAMPLQYADFTVWQNAQLDSPSMSEQLAYWTEQFAQPPVAVELPTDYLSHAQEGNGGAVLPFSVNAVVERGLMQLAASNDATLFMTLAAAFYVFIYRYCGQGDISLGIPVAGRGRLELESLIGLFTNMLVVRVQLSGEDTFPVVLKKVKQRLLAAYDNQDVPYEKLLELANRGQPVAAPLFEVVFSMQGTAEHAMDGRAAGVAAQTVRWHGNRHSKYALSLYMQQTQDGLVGAFEYQTALFRPETVRSISANFVHLLAGLVGRPGPRFPLTLC